MVNKLKNDITALIIVVMVVITGFFLIFWFYSIVATPEAKTDDTKKPLEVKDGIVEQITNQNDQNTPLLLEGNDFGRKPFW